MVRSHTNIVRIATALIAAALALMLPTSGGVVSAQEPSVKGVIAYAPLPVGQNSSDETDAAHGGEDSLAMAWCNYLTAGDNPHLSSSGFAASAHGWWVDLSPGECPEYADVEVWLQAHLCYYIGSEPQFCWYDTLDHKEKRIRAGGGSGKRTTVRHNCVSSQTVGYRSIIDVDLVGVWDGPGKTYKYADLPCYPAPKN